MADPVKLPPELVAAAERIRAREIDPEISKKLGEFKSAFNEAVTKAMEDARNNVPPVLPPPPKKKSLFRRFWGWLNSFFGKPTAGVSA
jgi:hypothetical protein